MNKQCKISEHLIRFYQNIPKKLMEHIQQCEECTEKLKTIKLMATLGGQQDYSTLEKTPGCPDENIFAAFLDGELPEEKQQKVEKHLLECSHCFHITAEYIKEHHPATETIEELLVETSQVAETASILQKAKHLSKEFIKKYYPEEGSWFDTVWESIEEALAPLANISLATIPQPHALGFSSKSNLTIAQTTIIIAGITKEEKKILSRNDLQKLLEQYSKKAKAPQALQEELLSYLAEIYKV